MSTTLTKRRKPAALDRRGDAYLATFLAYLKGGDDGIEALGLQAAREDRGGYAVPDSFQRGLDLYRRSTVTMRRLGTVLPPITGTSVTVGAFSTGFSSG